jgi:hypothetical protein
LHKFFGDVYGSGPLTFCNAVTGFPEKAIEAKWTQGCDSTITSKMEAIDLK